MAVRKNQGINRYIVGCKSISFSQISLPFLELIDTQWDVNHYIALKNKDCATELIDTQWDVNKISSIYFFAPGSELIDTQWDVNTRKSEPNATSPKN